MSVVLSKNWNFPTDEKAAKKAILNYLKTRRPLYGKPSEKKRAVNPSIRWNEVEALLGLAYTSSSDCAGLWICSNQLFLDAGCKFQIQGFVMEVSGEFFAYCQDENENELFVRI